jgi:hypothetical protein
MKTVLEKLNEPSKSNKPKKPNKRTQVLKKILDEQEGAKSVDPNTQTDSIVNIREDMLESTSEPRHPINDARMVTFGSNISNQATGSLIAQSIDLFKGLINKELAKVATLLGIDEIELKTWIVCA